MPFFVAVAESSSSIDPVRFRTELERRWPDAELEELDTSEREYVLEWRRGDFEGRLAANGTSVVLDGSLDDAADTALWLRSWMDDDVELHFFDEAYTGDVELRPATTREEIVSPFSA